jgi:type IV pilus assembly protein PilQ
MNKFMKTAGIIFLAIMSGYSDQAIAATSAKSANASDKSSSDVKLVDDNDPFAATNPTTEPTAVTTDSKLSAAPLLLNPDGTFSLNITTGADIVEQLRVIGFQSQMSIIPSKEVHGSLPAMDLYNVTVHEALDALLHSNGYAWREQGKFIYVYSAKEIADMEKASRVANTEVFHLFYTPAANAVPMIKPVLSADAQVSFTTPAASGLSTGVSDTGGNSHATDDIVVITDYPENLDRVRRILKEIDRRPQQILIEATILSAQLTENNQLGIDFNVVGGVDFSSIANSLGFTNGQLNGAGSGTATLGKGQQINSAGTGNSFSNFAGGGLQVGVVTNNISVFVHALEGVTDTTVLANPKILTLNKQKGEVIVGKETGYLTTTQTETTSTQTVQFLDTGTRLIFRPYIGDDGYIRMEIHPEDSDGGLITSANLPQKTTTEVTTNVMVKDGHTIVIGGLFRESSQSTRSQIPVLGNLPWAGPLFRQQADTTTRQELIVLITPHIIADDDAYSELSAKEVKDMEQLRVGVRKGMMFWGRERLANMYYENAVAEMNKPHPNRKSALWNLDAATNLNPKFIEAIHMKEDLTGKEVTDVDNSSVRSFVSHAILEDHAPATQPAAEVPHLTPATMPFAIETKPIPATQPLAKAPATQPAIAEIPVAKPVVIVAPPEIETPATQPVVEIPATQPIVEIPATQPVVEIPATQPVAMEPLPQEIVVVEPTTAPTTQPVANFGVSQLIDAVKNVLPKQSGEMRTSVTELPMDDAAGNSSQDDPQSGNNSTGQ